MIIIMIIFWDIFGIIIIINDFITIKFTYI